MTTSLGRALRAMLPVLAVLALAPAAALAGSPGKANLAKPAESNFDAFTKAPTLSQQAWMRDHYWRMRTYAPYFDSRLSWYPNAWSYQDAYAIYRGGEAGLEQYILKDAAGNRLYIPFHCSGGTCTQYAADIGNPGWRQRFIDVAKNKIAQGYKGIFVDDVNLAFKISNGNGTFVAPIDPRTGQQMTLDNWQRYFAEFMEQLRAALPATVEIVHNQVYFHAGLTNQHVRRTIEAASHIEIERGVIDTGIVGGTGKYGYETVLAWAEYAHSRGKGVIWDAQSSWGREYQLATNFLVANGQDGIAHPEGSNPDNWWSGWDTDLGEPLNSRYSWNGVFRRDFQYGTVLVNQPGQTTKTLTLDQQYTTLTGATTTTVTLPASSGAVLLSSTTRTPTPPPPPPPTGSDKAALRPATASSEQSGREAGKANDADSATRWSSVYTDNQWWQVDLGTARKVDTVELNWEVAYAKTYKIQTSLDGTTFTDAATQNLGAAGLARTTFATRDARYVRVLGVTRATGWGISFYDARVFGPDDGTTAPTDTTPPETTISAGPSGIVGVSSASFSFASEAGATFECRVDGGAWAACSSPKSLSGLADGEHRFDVRAKDAAGNIDPTPASRSWTVSTAAAPDTTAPDTSIVSGPSGMVKTRSATFDLGSTEAGSTFECSLDGAAWVGCADPLTLTGLAPGSHVLRVRARDAAGNVDATPASRSWTVHKNARMSASSSAGKRVSVQVRGRSVRKAGRSRATGSRVGLILERRMGRRWVKAAKRVVKAPARGRFVATFRRMPAATYRVRISSSPKAGIRVVLDPRMPRITKSA